MGQSILDKPTLHISADDMAALEEMSGRFNRPAGQILIEDTEESDHVLFLLKGYAKIMVSWPKRAVSVQHPGTFVGEMAVIRKKPRSGRVIALTDVEALLIPGERFLGYLLKHPAVMLELLRETEERLIFFTRKSAMSDLTSEIKLARALLELAETGIGEPDRTGLRFAFSQRDLGELSGVSRESVAKSIKEFKAQGLVDVGRGSTTILDLAGLRRLAASATAGER